jgi:hypothetical protein
MTRSRSLTSVLLFPSERGKRTWGRSGAISRGRSLNFFALALALCRSFIALLIGGDRPSSQSCSELKDTPSHVANFDWLSPVASRIRLI